ncbi:MAG TPA: F0F1 ATP synthase subunit A [Candidatus Paceibacterota bacterium]|jgi:F-type H+-transporting ATPase subunit a|nr:F0F1 ATP synthase subunit A [Candidatus Paceibacterota bacterium]
MQSGIQVILAPERLGTLFGIPITNTLLTSWAVIAVLLIIAVWIGSRLKLTPNRFQLLFEWLVEFIYDYVAETLESRDLARKFFPYLTTIFLFVFTSNLLEFLPGVGSVGFFAPGGMFTPLFRSVNTDLNVTLMLAIVSFLTIEVTGVVVIGAWKYAEKFINIRGGAIGFVVGLIELLSELGRLISFSFRLFGNIFAGEVLILVVTYFIPYVGPLPFMAFEIFVGFVQAAIFALLTLFFIKIAIAEPHGVEAH